MGALGGAGIGFPILGAAIGPDSPEGAAQSIAPQVAQQIISNRGGANLTEDDVDWVLRTRFAHLDPQTEAAVRQRVLQELSPRMQPPKQMKGY